MEIINNITNENADFWKVPSVKGGSKRSSYEIMVTVGDYDKKPHARITITLGEKVHQVFAPFKRAKVSSFTKFADKIYLGLYTEDIVKGSYSISRANKGKNPNPVIQYVLTEEEQAICSEHWAESGYYKLLFDSEKKLYYISNAVTE